MGNLDDFLGQASWVICRSVLGPHSGEIEQLGLEGDNWSADENRQRAGC
jgi:hypothetical protein